VQELIPQRGRSFVRSLERGLLVLQGLAKESRPLTLSEIARHAGINNPTASRFCYTLTQLGFIQRDPYKRYHLTPRVLSLGYAAIRGFKWREVAHFYLNGLSKEIRETVNLSVLDGHEIMYLIRIKTERLLPYDLQIGSKLPVHCTSMGKALMAFVSPERMRSILSRVDFRAFTHRTITGVEDYLTAIEIVRKQGYAINDEEQSVGLRSVAAPVRDVEGRAIAAINIAVPTKRYSRQEVEDNLAPQIVETAGKISNALAEMEWREGLSE